MERLRTASTTEQEALAIALGFNSGINKKLRFKALKFFGKSQNSSVRRSALVGMAFSSLLETKKPKSQLKFLQRYFKDPLSSIQLTAGIGLGISAFFTYNRKFKNKTQKKVKKLVKKKNDYVKQGLTVSMGLLGDKSKSPEKDMKFLIQSYSSLRSESPLAFFIGMTLCAMDSISAEVCIDFLLDHAVPDLTNKESRRMAVICSAFLLPLVPNPLKLAKLQKIVEGNFEFHSKFGTDLAITFTYFSLENDLHNSFFEYLDNIRKLDSDYEQLFTILSQKKEGMGILIDLIRSNTLDIKASGINASFFLEVPGSKVDLNPFIVEGLTQRDSGYFDRLLMLLRSFSFCILEKKYNYAKYFEPYIYSSDQQVKRFASLTYACLIKMNEENIENLDIYDRLRTEQDENVRWGLILGLSVANVIGRSPMDDELIIGLLLLCLGFMEAGSSLLLSQAMVPIYHRLEKTD